MAEPSKALTAQQLDLMHAWWRAANYLSVGQVYLLANPLLREPLAIEHVKPRLLGHWGTVPGLNFIYVHLNRIIRERGVEVLFVTGPGHGAPGVIANAWLEGTYSETYPDVSTDEEGVGKLFRQFSFPHGIPSHAAPDTPGSIHEGGELGYALSHAYGAVFDNPTLIAACVIGDGEAETGPLAASWHGNKFTDPRRDGAVLPILHLNGYKIANPTVLSRLEPDELAALLYGYGHDPIFVEGGGNGPEDDAAMHEKMAQAMNQAFAKIQAIWNDARGGGAPGAKSETGAGNQTDGGDLRASAPNNGRRPRWPMIVLRSPKGWTGPKTVDGLKTEGYWRSHQVPFADMHHPGHLALLENWLKHYEPETLFDANGTLLAPIAALAPRGAARMSANPHANGGALMRPLRMPDLADHGLSVPEPGQTIGEATRVLGTFLRDVMARNAEQRNFRVFSPDENNSNRLNALFDTTNRAWNARTLPEDDHLARDGRVMEILSEHTCQGWLEGYLLTGRHGLFSCYEAFIHLVDSMFNQHAKWLKSSKAIAWRRPISSLNYLLTSHVWQQDHNGFSHQDPGFIDHVVNKKADIVRVYLPPDANTLLWVADHCLRSYDRINVIVAGKAPAPQWLDVEAAARHCSQGVGIWRWASNDQGSEPDVVMACAGDVPTIETLAAVDLLHQHLPDLKVRVINVVDLMTLQPRSQHPHGLEDLPFDTLFTTDKPVIFAYHGYPSLIHRLVYKRTNHANFHVRGYQEEGSTTTAFDMVVRNHLDRFHLLADVIDRVPGLGAAAAYAKQAIRDKLVEHERYIVAHGTDMPEVSDWRWPGKRGE